MKNNQKAPFTRVVLALLVLLLSAASAWAAATIGNITYSNGYYNITKASDLADLATYVNEGGSTSGLTFKMTYTITVSDKHTPIGNTAHPFEGTFDGGNGSNKYIIIDAWALPVDEKYAGLFGVLGTSATVKNLTIYTAKYTRSVNNNDLYFGLIAGENRGTIDNCSIGLNGGTMNVSLSTYNSSYYRLYIGGIAGRNKGTIKNSSLAKMSLTANFSGGDAGFTGGIAGYNDGTISNCTIGESLSIISKGSHAAPQGYTPTTGGIVGQNIRNATVSNCTVERDVTIKGSQSTQTRVGGIAGTNYGVLKNNFITTSNISATGSYVGAITGIKQSSAGVDWINNYYRNISINGTKKYSGVGIGGYGDIANDNGAMPLVNITTKGYATVKTSTTFDYYIYKSTITIGYSGSISSGSTVSYTVTDSDKNVIDVTYSGNQATFTMPDKDVTVEASVQSAYSITYYVDGTKNTSLNPATYNKSSGATLPTPTKTGYTFSGWYTTSSCTGTAVTYIASGTTGNKTFYGKFKANTYTVVFHANDSGSRTERQTFTYDKKQNLMKNPFTTATGYANFLGWSTKASGSGGTTYSDGQAVLNLTSKDEGEFHLYGQWSKDIGTNSKITCTILSQTYTGKEIKPTVKLMDGTINITSYFTITYADNIKVGTATVTIGNSTNSQYTGTKIVRFNITKKSITIREPIANTPIYNGTAQKLVIAGKSDGRPMLYSLDNITFSEEIPTGINAGTYTTYYKVEETDTTYGKSGTVGTIIKKGTPTTIVAPVPKTDLTYTGDSLTLIEPGSTDLGEMYYHINGKNYDKEIPKVQNAGEYTVYYSVGPFNNIADNEGTVKVVVKKATPTITPPEVLELAFADYELKLVKEGSANSGPLLYSLDGKNYSRNIPTATKKGTYTVYYKVEETYNYNEASGSVKATIKDVPIVYVTEPKLLTYNGKEQDLLASAKTNLGTLLFSLDNENYSNTIPTAINVGTYKVYYKIDKSNTYIGILDSVEVTIAKAKHSLEKAPGALKNATYTNKEQQLVSAGSSTTGTILYSLDGKNYSEEIPTAKDPGTYVVYYKIEEAENYIELLGSVESIIPGTHTENAFLAINEVDGKKYAVIDGNNTSDEPFEITEDFEAENIQLTREFTVGEGYSTLVLPFEVETSKLSGIDNILKFVGIGVNEKNVKQVEMSTVWEKGKSNVKLEANKPYMVKMSSPALEVTGAVTFKATTTPIEEHNGWTFVGTYKFKEWTETSDELGRAYGFAGQSNDEVSAGQFVKVAAGAYINPMRAYLLAPAPVAKAKSANNVSATASINNYPEKIDMVIVDGEQTTVIGTLYTRTGEIRWNNTKRTFDLKGRHVGKDNTARGAYYKKIEPKK